MSRRKTKNCASDLLLDQSLAGELTGDEKAHLAGHLNDCDSCTSRFAELTRAHKVFATEAPSFEFQQPQPPYSGLAARAYGSAALILVAALVFLVLRSSPKESALLAVNRTRTKGSVGSFGWVVRRGGHVLDSRIGQGLHPGDQLRFTVTVTHTTYVAILGQDALEAPALYTPTSGPMIRVQAGKRTFLPGAVELDDHLGPERLLAVFCDEQRPVQDLLALLRGTPQNSATQSLDALPPWLPEGCSVDTETLYKEKP